MINGIGSYTGYQSYLQTQSTWQKSPDAAQMFGQLDNDGDGKLSQTELDTWASTMAEKTGQTIGTSEAISIYATDADGELSESELKSFLDASGIKHHLQRKLTRR